MMLIEGNPEFSRPFLIDRLGADAVNETIVSTAAERDRLVKRLGIVSVDQFAAQLQIERLLDSGIIQVTGRFEADIVQICAVTLTAFPSHVEDSFETEFATDPPITDGEVVLDLDSEVPEPIINGVIDLGELATQYLSLTLDPYPRAPGVSFDPLQIADEDLWSPFAVLKDLKRRE